MLGVVAAAAAAHLLHPSPGTWPAGASANAAAAAAASWPCALLLLSFWERAWRRCRRSLLALFRLACAAPLAYEAARFCLHGSPAGALVDGTRVLLGERATWVLPSLAVL